MVLWQFITLTVLISVLTGALLVYASIITRRLGCAIARLNKIEEVLRAKSRSVDFADTRAAEPKSEGSGGSQGRGRLLTIGDLRRLSSRATRSSNPNSDAASEMREAPNTPRGLMRSSGATTADGDSVAIASESAEALRTCGEELSFPGASPTTVGSVPTILTSRAAPLTSIELLSVLTVDAVSRNSPATTSATIDTQATNSERRSPPPSYGLPSDDPIAKKNRDMMLFLNSQRRRRRARLAY